MLNKKEYDKQYRIKNKERIKEYNKQYYINNKEKRLEYWEKYNNIIKNRKKIAEYKRKYYIRYKKERNEYDVMKRRTDLKYNLNCKMRKAIRRSLKNGKNGKHWEDLIGYACDDLIKRLKKTMPKGYTWQDFLQGRLHIDHIIPISIYNYTKPKHLDFQKCWALKNLQLLPAKENLMKHNRLSKPFQPALQI